MKAIILSGGEGSRLRPVTCDMPKPMARLCGRPVLEYTAELLLRNGVDSAAVTLKYLGTQIEEYFSDGKYKDLKLEFIYEDNPLGTAGGAKNAVVKCLGNEREPILIVSGDAVCDFELSEAYRRHVENNSDVTILLYEVDDPGEYGVVNCCETGEIREFIEKPGLGQAVCNKVNTGIYIINREIFDLIPDDKSFDFSRDLFPMLMRDGHRMFAYAMDGYWCDIGDIAAYMRCQRDMLNGRVNYQIGAQIAEKIYVGDVLPDGNYTIEPPVYIGKRVAIGDGSVIGPYTVLGDGATVGRNAKLRASVMLENSCAEDSTNMTGALLCKNARLKHGASMFEGAVAGNGAVIGKNASVKPNVLVWNEKKIEDGAVVCKNVKYGDMKTSLFENSEISSENGVDLSAEVCARIGSAVGSSEIGETICIGSDRNAKSKAMKYAFMSGLMTSGTSVWDFGECFEAQIAFFTSFCGLGAGVFISGGRIKVLGNGGFTLPRNIERAIENKFMKGDFIVRGDEVTEPSNMKSAEVVYKNEASCLAEDGVAGIPICIRSSNSIVENTAIDILSGLYANLDEQGTVFRISRSGTSLSIYDRELGLITHDMLTAVCCYEELIAGKNVSVRYSAPEVVNKLAAEFGKMRCGI